MIDRLRTKSIDATVDIGTNSVLLLVAKYPPFHVILDEARMTGLGRGLTQRFDPKSRSRTLKALEEYDRLCRERQAQRIVCVGTAAFRKASDGPEFMGEIQKKFSWETRILSGEEEARLSYLSVKRDFGEEPGLAALDIGGGSTEIISGDEWVSLELGTVILSERFFKHDPPLENEVSQMNHEIEEALSLALSPPLLTQERGKGGEVRFVGLAGTATTLSSINQRLTAWDPEKIQGSVIKLSELDAMISHFRRTTNEERKTIVGMVPGREDTLLAGSLILRGVMAHLRVDRVMVSDRGLRYGLLYEKL